MPEPQHLASLALPETVIADTDIITVTINTAKRFIVFILIEFKINKIYLILIKKATSEINDLILTVNEFLLNSEG